MIMGSKKKKEKSKKRKKADKAIRLPKVSGATKLKSKCCDKYRKGEHKRCKKCPCFDLLQKVA